MAGDSDRYAVGGAGSGYGAGGGGHADFFGEAAVGARFSAGNSLQCLPNFALKGGSPDV